MASIIKNNNGAKAHITYLNFTDWGLQGTYSENKVYTGTLGILMKPLKNDLYVKKLYLSNNRLGDKGAFLVCRMLRKNKGLRFVDLSFCSLTDEAVDYFIEILENRNETLKNLDISNNPDVSEFKKNKLHEILFQRNSDTPSPASSEQGQNYPTQNTRTVH
jgi:hypothetical protein